MRTQGGSKVSSFVSGVNQGDEVGRRAKTCFCYPRGVGASPLSFRRRGGVI